MPRRADVQVYWFAVALAMPVPLAVLLCFAALREQPEFWHNSGGWPVLMRQFVLVSFYPLLAVEAGVLGMLSASALGGSSDARGTKIIQGIVLTGLWLLLTCAMAIAFANNFMNILNGQPLHSHHAF